MGINNESKIDSSKIRLVNNVTENEPKFCPSTIRLL